MKIFFVLIIILFLAFSGYHLTFRSLRLPLFARKFYLTGIEFLFLGLLLGPQFFNIMDVETYFNLQPLVGLLLGWIGLICGFQFEIRMLRRAPVEFLLSGILVGLFVWGCVFGAAYLVLTFFFSFSRVANILIAITLASTASCTSHTGLALFRKDTAPERVPVIRLLGYISSLDGLIGLILFGLAFLFRPFLDSGTVSFHDFFQVLWVMIGVGAGLLLVFSLLLAKRRDSEELILIVIGVAVLGSGAASILGISPLFTSFFIGFCVVNLSREKERIFDMLISIEKPIYLLVLFFLGVNLHLDSGWLFVLALLFCLYRYAGKIAAGFLLVRSIPALRNYPPFLGLGLLDQGGLALAIALDFQIGIQIDIASWVVSLVLLATIYNDFISPFGLKYLLSGGK
ncbi:MAG: hypothetical protein JRF40_13950 [Deltaproteobacteria bacterium]|nr:hypothetical protein [Deltaproteobacteria bacterium]